MGDHSRDDSDSCSKIDFSIDEEKSHSFTFSVNLR
jgi:hypothetical protein